MIKYKNMQKAALLGPQDMSFDMSQSGDNNSAAGQECMNGDQKKKAESIIWQEKLF
jgi:hypothetical protein